MLLANAASTAKKDCRGLCLQQQEHMKSICLHGSAGCETAEGSCPWRVCHLWAVSNHSFHLWNVHRHLYSSWQHGNITWLSFTGHLLGTAESDGLAPLQLHVCGLAENPRNVKHTQRPSAEAFSSVCLPARCSFCSGYWTVTANYLDNRIFFYFTLG